MSDPSAEARNVLAATIGAFVIQMAEQQAVINSQAETIRTLTAENAALKAGAEKSPTANP